MPDSAAIIEDNKHLARSLLLDVWRDRKVELIPVLLHSDFERHNPHQKAVGHKAYLQVMETYWRAFSDLQYDIRRIVADEHHVAATYSVSGIHTGSFMWIPPTGRGATIDCLDFFEVRDGKLSRVWTLSDDVTLLRAMGLHILPGPVLLLRTLWQKLKGLTTHSKS